MNAKQATVKFFKNHPNQSPIVRRVCHKRKVPVRATEFVHLSDLVPEQWKDWFYPQFSETNEVTFGDANRTMITAEYLADIVQDMDIGGVTKSQTKNYIEIEDNTTESAMREWLKKVRRLGQIYVDLENQE